MEGLFISWTRENGRTAGLARELGLEPCFIYRPGGFGLLGRYARQLRTTRKILRERAPRRVLLMLPPAPALLSFAGSLFRDRSARPTVACDLHTGFFSDPKWRWACRTALGMMRRRGFTAIVTNLHLRDICLARNVPAVVLHDVIEQHDPPAEHGPYVLLPLSYANDEPVVEILEAARQVPEIEWRLTGRAPDAVRAAAPENVTFTGFVDDAEYASLMAGALGVVALTTRPHTMQRAGYEAFSLGVPQVTSDFPELREFYADSARYADPASASIAEAVRGLMVDRDTLTSRLLRVRAHRVGEQRHALEQLRLVLDLPTLERGSA